MGKSPYLPICPPKYSIRRQKASEDSWDGAPRPTTTRSLKPREVVDPVKIKHHSPQRQRRQRHYYQNTSEGMNSPTQRGSRDGAPRPTTNRSLKPRGVDPVKIKRHSPQRQRRQRHYYQNTPSEEMDSPTKRGSWDDAPRPTTTRSLKPRGVVRIQTRSGRLVKAPKRHR